MKKIKNLKLRLRREYQFSGARVIQRNLKSRRGDTMAAKSISYRCSCFKLCFGSRLLTRVECVAARLRLFSCGSHDWFLRASITKPKATTLSCNEECFAVASGSAWITSTFSCDEECFAVASGSAWITSTLLGSCRLLLNFLLLLENNSLTGALKSSYVWSSFELINAIDCCYIVRLL